MANNKVLKPGAFTLLSLLVSGAVFMTFSLPAVADHDDDDRYERDYDERRYAYSARSKPRYAMADVIGAEPITRLVTVKTPVRECWDETRYEYEDDERGHGRSGHRGRFSPGAGSTIAGGLIGGVVGRQFGGGKGRDAMTVVGTLVGAAIGADNARHHREHESRSAEVLESESYEVRRCNTHYESREEERIDGYRVTYLFNGEEYTTRTRYEPDEKIRVRVDVRPAERD